MSTVDPVPAPHHTASARPRVAVTVTQCWHRVPGGTATSVLDLLAALDAAGDVPELVAVAPRSGRDPGPGWAPAVPTVHLSLPIPVLYDAWTRLRRPSVESATGPVDLVHLTVPITPPRSPAPLVATVHDVLPLSDPGWFTGRGARLMRRGLEVVRDEAALVMVPSRATAEAAAAHGFDDDRLRVVPWGSTPVDVDVAAVASARARHGLSGPYVLFVGTTEPRKGLEVLGEAMVRLARAEVTLALAGPVGWGDADRGALDAVPGPVVRLGFVPRADLPALQRGAAVSVVPSLAEGFGLPALEALAAGAALVTTSGTACAEVAGDAAVLVPPGDVAALADAIGALLDDPGRAEALRAGGPARAAHFDWGRTASAVAAVYREVLG